MAGRGSLAGLMAYGDANAIVVEMAREVLPVVRQTPVLAGVNGADPFCLFDPFLDDLKRLGFAGVQNFPTVGLIDGPFRANLEETGMSYALEVDLIAMAQAGAKTGPSLETCQALAVNGDAIILVHGGPVAEPADAEHILRNAKHCHGFYGASSMERLPTERAMTDQTRKFKAIGFG